MLTAQAVRNRQFKKRRARNRRSRVPAECRQRKSKSGWKSSSSGESHWKKMLPKIGDLDELWMRPATTIVSTAKMGVSVRIHRTTTSEMNLALTKHEGSTGREPSETLKSRRCRKFGS